MRTRSARRNPRHRRAGDEETATRKPRPHLSISRIAAAVASCCLTVDALYAEEPPEQVSIRGVTMTVWPASDLRQSGFDVPDIPRDQNAAWTYLEANNTFAELPDELGEDDKPHLIPAVKLADVNLFQQHLQNLVTGYRLPIETMVYRGVQIVSRGDAGSPALAPAVIDDYLVIGGSTGQLVSAIEARAEGETLDASPDRG